MKVKVLRAFEDVAEKVHREPGDEFEASKERAQEIATALNVEGECPYIEFAEEVVVKKAKR